MVQNKYRHKKFYRNVEDEISKETHHDSLITIRVSKELVRQLQEISRLHKTNISEMLRSWLKEKINSSAETGFVKPHPFSKDD